SALEVVENAAPLPAPPTELLSDDGLVHVSWLLARDARQDGVAGAVVRKLTFPPAKAVPALLAAQRVDEAAARAAGALAHGDATLVPAARDVAGAALAAVLGGDQDPAVRLAAVAGLGGSGWRGADAALRKLAVEANDLKVQSAALRALGDLGDAG